MHLSVGDRLSLVSRLDSSRAVQVQIVGIWHVDPADAWHLGDPLETTGTTTGGTYTTRGPLLVREADVLALSRGRLDVEWRGIPNVAALGVDDVESLRHGSNDLAARLRGSVPASTSPRVTTALPRLLDDVGRSVLVSRSGVILLTIQFAVLAGYAVVLVAGMLVERRRTEIALIRSRGASAGHLILMALLESIFLALPAAILAPIFALGVVALLGAVGPTAGLSLAANATISQTAIAVAALAGVACVIALTLPTLFVAASPAGARAATGRQARTTLGQRLGLDLALIAVAGVALWQLRLYGAPLTRNARGTLGLDPLLVAAPAIGLIGGAVLALRVVPRVAELGERVLIRGRGLVGSLGGRQLARRPLRYTRAALLLMLAAALGTLAAAHAATWSRSQSDQANYQAVADVRTTTSDYTTVPEWAAGPKDRAIPGVTAAMPVVSMPFDIGRTVREGRLVGLDPAAYASVVSDRAASDATGPSQAEGPSGAAMAALAAATTPIPVVPLPGAPARVAVVIDADFREVREQGQPTQALAPDTPGLTATLVLRDGDGRLFRTDVASGVLNATQQRLEIVLGDASGARAAAPLAIEAIEVTIAPPAELAVIGKANIARVEATESPAGDARWTPVTIDGKADGWRWQRTLGGQVEDFTPSPTAPNQLSIGTGAPVFGGFGDAAQFRLVAGFPNVTGDEGPVIPIIASDALMARTGADVGDQLEITSLGRGMTARIVGTTSLFAPFDPGSPFAIADLTTVDTIQFLTTGRTQAADEWWLRVAPGTEAAVLVELRKPAAGNTAVIGREELTRELTTDPVPLGLIGVLGLGSVAAMLFAGIGFLVSSTVSTSERIGEFALLRALGLSTGQLAAWLSIESVFLLVIGLVAGSLLGLLLAWLVLPFATLTQTGIAPIPAPVVIVPWEAIVPVYAGAVVLFIVSLWLTRRQLPDIRISGVLRARES